MSPQHRVAYPCPPLDISCRAVGKTGQISQATHSQVESRQGVGGEALQQRGGPAAAAAAVAVAVAVALPDPARPAR